MEEKDLLPKWAKRHLQKYRKGKSSSEDEGDENNTENDTEIMNTEIINTEIILKETEVGSSYESKNDVDDDPSAKRVEIPFYQNIDEELHLRRENEAELDENEDFSNLINISNPRGANFMKFAENQVLPTYQEILSRLNFLKTKTPTPDKFKNITLYNI